MRRLPLLTSAEREQLLRVGPLYEPGEQCLPELVQAQVERTPDAIALGCGPEQVSYEQLNDQANTLAHLLVAHGVQPEEVVAVLAERSIALVTAMLGSDPRSEGLTTTRSFVWEARSP